MSKFSNLAANLKGQISCAEVTLAKWQARLAEDPSYAFQWSSDAFKAAATLDVLRPVVVAVENGAKLEDIVKHVNSQALRAARYPERSTSAQSNVLAQDKGAVWAKLAEYLEYVEAV